MGRVDVRVRQSDISLETTLLNVAILPPQPIAAEVQRLSGELQTRGGLIHVDGQQRLAHMTLYMARFSRLKIDEIVLRVEALAASRRSPITSEHTGYYLTPGNYYEVSYARSPSMMSLHNEVSDALLPLRFSPGQPVVEDFFAPYSAAQEEQAKRSGYDLSGDLYRPHVTITRFATRPTADLPTSPVDLSFNISRIGLFEADKLGAVTEPIACYDLG
ncbi:hypothetical protein O7602_28695 [Micromonospora sp. WMMD1128]|uniref:2'-5' RNA ligase family protein n=1 Tax=unclassified Micromonospora TaxID=2617518 RepID=UPI00248AA602|nr:MULTISPECIES: 2'-5' RNA ligase family protein [unclassified Micromonospora]WBB73598.1 hypothetical protein O7602_28695 [Micromonospora sp. WMMD1128]WFE33009.1 hypothetical protein O7613_26275 [Micromonospora sp. WMMD975]